MPSLLVFVSYCTRVRSLTMTISAPAITFVSGSNTMPPIEPVGDCAEEEIQRMTRNQAARVVRTRTPFPAKRCTVNPRCPVRVPTRMRNNLADYQLISLGIIFEGTQTDRHCAKVSGIPDVTLAVAPNPAVLGFLVMDDSELL